MLSSRITISPRKVIVSALSLLFSALMLFLNYDANTTLIADAQGGLPPNNRARGLVFDGLEVPTDGSCKSAFKVKQTAPGNPHCTHGPDASPTYLNVAQSVPPVASATSSAALVTCDGDGVSGKRVQVVYAHASDVTSRFAAYLASIQQWSADADAIFQNSAAETGGSRHIRFVHDANCGVIVADVTLSTAGDDSIGQMANDLTAQGYNRTDRNYLVFVDAAVYCGIGGISNDDRPGAENISNLAPNYARIDAGCWSGVIASHELMHNLGGVQVSAPHSSGEWHCWDGVDNMCRPTNGTLVQAVCADPGYVRFDCNHDDYFHTNPPLGSYLATHWDAAVSQFLISANLVRTDSIATSNAKSKTFTSTSVFKPYDTVWVRVHVVDQYRANRSGASVVFTVGKNGSAPQCALTATTNSLGNGESLCQIPTPNYNPYGVWNVRVTSVSLSRYPYEPSGSWTDQTFTVQ